MPELIIGALPLLIPIIALSIGLVVIVGGVIVQPLTKALTRLATAQEHPHIDPSGQRVADVEKRMAALERTLEQILEEQHFQRELQLAPASSEASTRAGSRELRPPSQT
jgi:hypothetical protein